MAEHMKIQETAAIVLDRDVLAAICRRGRQRLRDIQSASQATLKLDHFRSVLQVTGSKEDIACIQRQLESLSGPRLEVTTAVWAELMRTRTNADSSRASVARIQQESGCRIHIERDVKQVRLFGKHSEIVIADRLLDQLDGMCVEEGVEVKWQLDAESPLLQDFSQEFGVTLQVEGNHLTVLGIEGAVGPAAKELRNYKLNEKHLEDNREDVNKSSEAARLAIIGAMTKMVGDGSDGGGTPSLSGAATADTLPDASPPSDHLMEGVVKSKLPPSAAQHEMAKAQGKDATGSSRAHDAACETCGSSGIFCAHCGKPTGSVPEYSLVGCPTCGCVKFCVFCGQSTQVATWLAKKTAPTRVENKMAPARQRRTKENRSGYKPPNMYGAGQVGTPPVQYAVPPNAYGVNPMLQQAQQYMAGRTSQYMNTTWMIPVSSGYPAAAGGGTWIDRQRC